MFCNLRLYTLTFAGTDGYKHGGDPRHLSKSAQAVDEDGHARQFKKLFRCRRNVLADSHARAQPRCWKNDENPHKHWSIQESQ